MAPKKRPANDDDAEQKILDYLRRSNRPYSINDIVTNLAGKVGKAAVQKATKQLEQDGAIKCKVNGKQLIYCITQSDPEDISSMLLAAEKDLMQLDHKKKHLQEKNRELEKVLKKYEHIKPMKEIVSSCGLFENKITEMSEKLAIIKNSMDESKDSSGFKAELELSKKQLKKYREIYKERKELFCNMFDVITENMSDKPKKIKEDIGIVDDLEASFDIKKY
ncbi:hypothetical protein DSO57_1021739 [Entomophthora muscae]|uniref:Uncharacterized protein n=1 Tax=Entomophthora muscae TaxID=34485 RepID=A0ACC2RHY8_9FUNG|nr:hypothetical protein DSO57_1021739 [Entomophthora muscae]